MIGLEKGRNEGRKEGREEGREEEKRAIAKSLKNSGIDVCIIAQNTELSEEVVEGL